MENKNWILDIIELDQKYYCLQVLLKHYKRYLVCTQCLSSLKQKKG